MVYILIIL